MVAVRSMDGDLPQPAHGSRAKRLRLGCNLTKARHDLRLERDKESE